MSEPKNLKLAFGGIPPADWGDEVVEHKDRKYPVVLSNALDRARETCLQFLKEVFGVDETAEFVHQWVLQELMQNAIHHGHGFNPERVVEVEIFIQTIIAAQRQFLEVTLHVVDEGEWFDLHAVPDPTEAEDIDSASATGRGTFGFLQIVESQFGHPATIAVDKNKRPVNKQTGKGVTVQWRRELPVTETDAIAKD